MGGRSRSAFKAIVALVAATNLTLSLVACGGTVRTDGEPDDPDPKDKDPETSPTASSPSGGSGSGGPQVDLPACKQGVKQAEAESCSYLYKGRCWDDKLEACGCACASKPNSTCLSGFPKDDVPTEVSCF